MNITTLHNHATSVAFKNYALFIQCIKNIDGTIIGNAEDLDLVMSMYNFIKYSSDYSDLSSSLRIFSKDWAATNFDANITNNNAFKSFKYQVIIMENTFVDGNNAVVKNATIAVPLNYLGTF